MHIKSTSHVILVYANRCVLAQVLPGANAQLGTRIERAPKRPNANIIPSSHKCADYPREKWNQGRADKREGQVDSLIRAALHHCSPIDVHSKLSTCTRKLQGLFCIGESVQLGTRIAWS